MLTNKIYSMLWPIIVHSVLLLWTQSVFSAQLLEFKGVAKDLDTKSVLYTESHKVMLNEQGDYLSSYVVYSDPEGVIFAEKTLDFAKSAIAPDMVFYDKRNGERISVNLVLKPNQPDELQLIIDTKSNKQQSSISTDSALALVDAGFDRFVERRWQKLRKEKRLAFSFLAITREKLVDFEVVEEKAEDGVVHFELHPDNFFIKLLVDPIQLEYDIHTKRLKKFTGLTNIRKFVGAEATGDNYRAEITYEYKAAIPVFSKTDVSTGLTASPE